MCHAKITKCLCVQLDFGQTEIAPPSSASILAGISPKTPSAWGFVETFDSIGHQRFAVEEGKLFRLPDPAMFLWQKSPQVLYPIVTSDCSRLPMFSSIQIAETQRTVVMYEGIAQKIIPFVRRHQQCEMIERIHVDLQIGN